jgi:hypothetical protein
MAGLREREHEHHWHEHAGAVWMAVPDGHIVQKCCRCWATRTVHRDHAGAR